MDLSFRLLEFPISDNSLEAFLNEVGITARIISKKPQNRWGRIQWACVEFEKQPIGMRGWRLVNHILSMSPI